MFVVYKTYDDTQYSYDVDDGLWDNDARQHRARRAVNTDNMMSTTAMLATNSLVHDAADAASFYDDTDYYSNVYDNTAYDDYQFYSDQSHYNKV